MKRLILTLLFILSVSPNRPTATRAFQNQSLNVTDIAANFNDAQLFAASRIDKPFLDELDSIALELPATPDGKPTRLSGLITALFNQTTIPLGKILPILGAQYVAVGVNKLEYLDDPNPATQAQARVRLLIAGTFSHTAIKFAIQGILGATCTDQADSVRCSYQSYQLVIYDNQLFVFFGQEEPNPQPSQPLGNESNFVNALGAASNLCSNGMDAFIYVKTADFTSPTALPWEDIRTMLSVVGLPPDQLTGSAVSVCSVAARGTGNANAGPGTLKINVVQLRSGEWIPPAPINPDFAKNIPAESTFLWTHNLGSVVNAATGLLVAAGMIQAGDIETALSRIFQLNFQQDVLEWATKADYALFLWLDKNGQASDPSLSLSDVQVGFVIEGDSPDKVRQVADDIATGLQKQSLDGVTFNAETYAFSQNGTTTPIPVMRMTVKGSNPGEMDLFIGSAGNLGFLATKPALDRIFGGDTVNKDHVFQYLSANNLSDVLFVLYLGPSEISRLLFSAANLLGSTLGSTGGQPVSTNSPQKPSLLIDHALLDATTSSDGAVLLTFTIGLTLIP